MEAIWLWNWGDGVRYAIEPNTEGGYDSVVETGLHGSMDREHWESLEEARAKFRPQVAERAERGEDGADRALAELDALTAPEPAS